MLIPPHAALALATALAPLPSVPIATGVETFALGSMQWRRHEIELAAGQFLRATVEQRGVDVKLRLVAPDGRVLEADVDSSEGPVGLEPASLLATADGVHAIEVWSPADVPAPGSYALETEAPRTPDARDLRRLEAEGLMAAGGRVMGPRAASGRRPRPESVGVWDAVAFYALAVPLWAELDEPCWEAEATTCLAINLVWSNGSREAVGLHERALGLWTGCPGADYKRAEALLFQGRGFVAVARLGDAADAYELGLRTTDDPVLRLQFLVQLSFAYGQLGDTDRALRRGEEALPILRERGFDQGTAVVLTHLANAHYRRGELQEASALAAEALSLRRAVGDELGVIATLIALGNIYDALGEPEIAVGYLEEVTGRYAHLTVLEQVHARLRLARILADRGETEAARARLEGALEYARVIRFAGFEPLLQLARLQLDTGASAQARATVDAVLAGAARMGDRYLAAQAHELSGRIHLDGGDLAAARTALDESLTLRRSIGDREGEATALHQRARVEVASGDVDAARLLLEDARAIVARQRVLLATPQLRATWAGAVRGIDEEYVGVLMALHRLQPGAGFQVRAFEASEAASARSLLELLSQPGAFGAAAPPPWTQERSVRERLTAALDRQMRAISTGRPPQELERAAREVLDLSAEHQRAEAAARAADPRSAALSPEPLRLADVQERLLDADTMLLEFSLGPDRGYAWLVGHDRLHAYELPARARIEAAAADLRAALSQAPVPGEPDRARSALRDLARMVLPRDGALLRGKRLVVVADGALHHVPFAALPDASGEPLVARFEIANVPSASVAAALRRLQAERPPAPRAIMVLADPVYDAGDERLPGRASAGPADAALARVTRDFGFKDGRLPRLPFTRREALALRSLAPRTSRAALDFAANLDTALSSELPSYRYVHFATHGLLNDARPELSGLVLSLVDRQGRPRSGLLTAPDVASLRLNADLVVLSSCRSAVGREVRGEGLVGLTRAFLYAGAPRVVASLWPVDDLASSELMAGMYRAMLGRTPASPAAALRVAQLATRRNPQWRSPYYWAGFQLQGEWR